MSNDFQAAYNIGASAELKLTDVNGIKHAIVPPGADLVSLEYLLPAPTRIISHPIFTDVDGFHEYITDFKNDGTRIFVDEECCTFITIFDCYSKEQTAWCDHQASLGLKLSNLWVKLKHYADRKMQGDDFAEFLEDQQPYITGPVTGADLFLLAQNFKVKLKGEVESESTVQAGLKKLVIKDESRLYGEDTNGLEIEFPETLIFELPIFENCQIFKLPIRLRHRISDNKPVFWISIADPEQNQRQAFDAVFETVKEKIGLPMLKGKLNLPSQSLKRK